MNSVTLLLLGVATAVVFVAVILIEGALRPGYEPMYHTGSELELGERGWIQRANFLLMGGGVFALALGVERSLGSTVGALLLGIFGLGMIIAGVFPPDPMRGYPPGSTVESPAEPTWQHLVHHVVSGPVAFLALLGACLTLAFHLEGPWRLYTILTAVVGLGFTAGTAFAFQTDHSRTGLIQRGLIFVYWSWIVLVGIHLAIDPPG